jgi:hypothetical protein
VSKSEAVGSEFDKADRLRVVWIETAKKLMREVGVSMNMKLPDEKKLQESIDKTKKKAQLFVTLVGTEALTLEVRVGSASPVQIGKVDLSAEKDMAKRREVLNNLARNTGLITEKEVWKWHDTHYDDVELSFFRGTISEMEINQAKLTAQRDKLDKLSFGSGEMRGALKEWAARKSWKHYIDFVEDIDDGATPKKIVDTYVKDGASLPVNLPAPMKKKIEDALAAGGAPDFAAARKLIVQLIDVKIVTGLRKEMLPPIKKEVDRLRTAIPEKRKAYAVATSGK